MKWPMKDVRLCLFFGLLFPLLFLWLLSGALSRVPALPPPSPPTAHKAAHKQAAHSHPLRCQSPAQLKVCFVLNAKPVKDRQRRGAGVLTREGADGDRHKSYSVPVSPAGERHYLVTELTF